MTINSIVLPLNENRHTHILPFEFVIYSYFSGLEATEYHKTLVIKREIVGFKKKEKQVYTHKAHFSATKQLDFFLSQWWNRTFSIYYVFFSS